MTRPVRALLFGLGPIGCEIGRLAGQREDIALVGAVDSAPDKAGRRLSEVLGTEAPPGGHDPAVEAGAAAALAAAQPQIVLHATGSYLPDVLPQLLACIRAGAAVVSTCEELSYPWRRHPELAEQLDGEAKDRGVAVLGTGINPGFVMDTLALVLSGACQMVEAIRLTRVVDVSTRRQQLQRKVGAGLTLEEFRRRAASGRFGHVGLPESCWLVAEGLGWRLDSLEETLDPVAAAGGRAAGMRQTARGTLGGRTVIDALVQMSAGAERPRDEIRIDGAPPVHMIVEGGIQGDLATAAIVVNAVPRVAGHAPGLLTMLDLPIVAGRGAPP